MTGYHSHNWPHVSSRLCGRAGDPETRLRHDEGEAVRDRTETTRVSARPRLGSDRTRSARETVGTRQPQAATTGGYSQSLLIISPVTECCHLAIGD